jgi:putative transposase
VGRGELSANQPVSGSPVVPQTVTDNAVAESFFATLKTECVYTRRFATRADARETIFEFIEGFYNRRRRHSTIGYVSPVEFEVMFNQEKSTEKLAA